MPTVSRGRVAIVAGIAAAVGIAATLLFTAGPLGEKSSDEEGTIEHPKTLPHHEYVEKADEVCHNIEVKQAHLDNTIFKGIPFTESPPPRLYAKYVKALIPTYTEQMNRLRTISPPPAERAKLQRYFTATERAVALLRKVAVDPKKVALLGSTDVFAKADEAARALDLKACGHAED
jgi:hypothetical protein